MLGRPLSGEGERLTVDVQWNKEDILSNPILTWIVESLRSLQAGCRNFVLFWTKRRQGERGQRKREGRNANYQFTKSAYCLYFLDSSFFFLYTLGVLNLLKPTNNVSKKCGLLACLTCSLYPFKLVLCYLSVFAVTSKWSRLLSSYSIRQILCVGKYYVVYFAELQFRIA